jgi:propionate CoA-transferase
MSARQAVAMVPDGAVVMTSGMGPNLRPGILYFAFREVFKATGHPRNLTWITASAAGSRDKVPGTVDDVAIPGHCSHYISAHLETARAMLRAGAKGEIEIDTLPQGQLVLALEAQGRGEASVLSDVGIGTFVDPRVGTGSAVTPNPSGQLVSVDGEQLRYTLPPITCASVMATEADEEGNIYMRNASLLTEVKEAVLAAMRNGGLAIVTVAEVIPKCEAEIFLSASEVDAIVVGPRNEQTMTVPQRRHWKMFLPGAQEDVKASIARMVFVNRLLKVDPVRGPLERALARTAALQVSQMARPGNHILYGYGLPQEVGSALDEAGMAKDVKCLLETGTYGGIPAPGLFFGVSVNPELLMTSAEMFQFCRQHLDVTILGMLQVDSDGNVNVSRKTPAIENYVGPGGFIDLVCSAKAIIFIGAFQERAKTCIQDGLLKIETPGRPKFVERVREITFNGREAVRRGQKVIYVTTVGIFRLTEQGLELAEAMPGIDIAHDILGGSEARIHVPQQVGQVPTACLTGQGYQLAWR